MVLALVMTTSFPIVSHAMMPHDSAKVEKEASSKHGDCHKHAKAEQSDKTAQNGKDSSDKCCDKGICKCVGGTCHNSLLKIFSNGANGLFRLTSNTHSFNFTNDVEESALSNRLKRPPKA